MQGGVHLLSGLVLASLNKKKDYKLGAVFGAIFPDIDIFITGIVYLIAGETAAMEIHRSFTHSLLMVFLFTAIPIGVYFIPKIKKNESFNLLHFAIGFGIGMFVHIMLDTLYLSYVQLFWPFSAQEINFAIVPVTALSEIQLRLLQVTDFYTDIFFFYIPILFIAFKKNLHKKIRIPFLIYILVDFAVITFFMFNAFTSPVDYNQFVINLYHPGVFFLLISVFSPILFKEVINDFKFKTRDIVIILSLFVFSQFLFWVATF